MSGLNLLRQSLVKRSLNLWLRVSLLALVAGGLAAGVGPSCVVPDPEYCANTEQCLPVATELGMMPQVCHPSRHVCVVPGPNTCFRNEDCIADFKNPRCDLTTNSCAPCSVGDNSSCAHFTERPLCMTASTGSGTLCVACQINTDCPKEKPICDGQQCRKCSSHSDCEGEVKCDSGNKCIDSLVCIQEGDLNQNPDRAGQCAQNVQPGSTTGSEIVYVNGSDRTKCGVAVGATGNSLASPLCTLDEGLAMAQLQGRHYIRVVGTSGSTQAGLNGPITMGSYAFIGAPAPTKGFPDMVTIQHRGVAFDVSSTGSVMVDQFNIFEVNPAVTVLNCTGGATAPGFTLRRSILTGSTPNSTSTFAPAIMLIGCNAIIDSNIIGVTNFADVTNPAATAHGVGINIIDNNGLSGLSSYLIQNNVIAGNASIGISIAVGFPTSKFVLRFNTIYGNGRGLTSMTNSPGGVGCPGGALKEFSHSIIAGNFKYAGSQVSSGSSSCSFKDIIVDSAEMGSDPAFTKVSTVDTDLDTKFRLLPGASWGIDKVSQLPSEILPSQDVYGVARPQNGKWDIGAAEYKP